MTNMMLLLAVVVAAIATDSGANAAVVGNTYPHGPGSGRHCKGEHQCPANCFATVEAKAYEVGGTWTISIPNCMKPNNAGETQSIAWGPTDSFGRCDSCPNEAKNVMYGDSAITVTIDEGQCKSKDICIWVTDSSYSGGKATYIPEHCAPNGADKCNVCGPYKVSPQLPKGYACDDGIHCTTGDECTDHGTCSGTKDDGKCGTSTGSCATGKCEPWSFKADAKGCKPYIDKDVCDDHDVCTRDVCKADPFARYIPDGTAVDESGCVHITRPYGCCSTKTACPYPACQECTHNKCVAKTTGCSCEDAGFSCKACEVCSVEVKHGVLKKSCKSNCEEPCKVCTASGCKGSCGGGGGDPCPCGSGTNFDVQCYKCGDNPLSCLVTGNPGAADLAAIKAALKSNCGLSGGGVDRTCAEQQCSNGILVSPAPAAATGECLLSTNNGDPCPCVPNSLSNLGRYQVCVTNGVGTLCTASPSCTKVCENCLPSNCPFGDLCSPTPGECTLPAGSSTCDTAP